MDLHDAITPQAQTSNTPPRWRVSAQRLREILDAHEEWLTSDGTKGERANLAWADLTGASLSGANLQGANLQGTDLRGADLQGADLRADLPKADLRGANLQQADLRAANLREADLRGVKLQGASLVQVILQGASLQGCDLRGHNLEGAKLQGANLQDASLRANLAGADLQDANLQGADLWEANLQGADLRRADLQGAGLVQAGLQEAKFQGANLRGAVFQGTDLTKVRGLVGAQLGGTDVSSATLPDPLDKFEGPLSSVEEASKNARLLFFSMLLACVYAWLTIGTTTDVRLLTNSASSPLPVIGVPIPIVEFYCVAPFALLALYIYLHLSLQSLWEELANLPAYFPDGRPLDKRMYPWLLSGLVRYHFALLRNDRPLVSQYQALIAMPLAWWVMPFTGALFWLTYLRRHEWGLTAVHLVFLVFVIVCALVFQGLTKSTLRGQLHTPTLPEGAMRGVQPYKAAVWGSRKFAVVVALALLMTLSVSYGAIHGSRSHSGVTLLYPPYQTMPEHPHVRLWDVIPRALAFIGCSPFADFEEVDVSTKPPNWTGSDLTLVDGAHLRGRDLRYASAAHAFLAKADLREVDLTEAVLVKADLRQATVFKAKLQGARLEGANLQETSFIRADLSHASFWEANLDKADLRGADLTGATGLTRKQLESAVIDGYTRLPSHLRDVRMPTLTESGE